MLGSAILTEVEMRDGVRCEPFELHLPLDRGYDVVHRKGAALRPAALALKRWLLQIIQADRPPLH